MENLTVENFKPMSEIIAEFETEEWHDVFMSKGIPANYVDKWLFNYNINNLDQGMILARIKEIVNNRQSILLLGEIGNGKTHLAISILKNFIVRRKKGHYYTLTQLFRAYRNSMSDPNLSEGRFIARTFDLDCLVIDEINIRSDSESENRFLQELVDSRHVNGKRTIFIGNMTKDEFSEIMGERIMDRLTGEEAEMFNFTWDSYR